MDEASDAGDRTAFGSPASVGDVVSYNIVYAELRSRPSIRPVFDKDHVEVAGLSRGRTLRRARSTQA